MNGKTGFRGSVIRAGVLACAMCVAAPRAATPTLMPGGLGKAAALAAPSNLTATIRGQLMSGDLDVLLEWADENVSVEGFAIERRSGTDDYLRMASVAAEARQYLDTTTLRGTRYVYRVRAYAGADTSAPSDTVSISLPRPPILVTAPEEGAVWYLGQEQRICWSAPSITTIQIDYTLDEGESWLPITMTGGVSQSSPNWGNYPWTPPLSIGAQPRVQIRVAQYQAPAMANFSGVFSLAEAGAVRRCVGLPLREPGLGLVRESAGWSLYYRVEPGRRAVIELWDMSGRAIGRLALEQESGRVSAADIPARACIVARLGGGSRGAGATSVLSAAVLGAASGR